MRSVRLGLLLLLTFSACGPAKVPSAPGTRSQQDSGTDVYAGDASGGMGGTGGKGSGGAGGAGGTMMVDAGGDALAPSVSFLTPTPAADANSEDVITKTSLSVRCKVEPSLEMGAAKIDKSLVKIAIQKRDDSGAFIDGVVSAVADTEFEATFDVSDRPNGQLSFQCRATDVKQHTASKVLTTLIDLGPTIILSKPQDMHRYALKTPMAIEFQVKPAPIADGDSKADVKSVVLNVGGVDTPVTESTDTPGLYQTSIDFSDKVKFPVQPDAVQLMISATNARAPTAATRILRASVFIDGAGPTIDVKSPANGSIQRGVVPLSVVVMDPSGIMPGTLVATINTKRYTNWDGMAPNFVLSFDTNQLDPTHQLIQLTINITAIDSVGNKTDPPVSLVLQLDNVPPVVALDPPMIVESHYVQQNVYCTQPFDPVGDAAANDKQTVARAQVFRALVEDRTNETSGASFLWYAGVNVGSVEMYTQALLQYPLLVDTNGDGICDAINKSDDMNIRDTQRVTPDNDPIKIKLDPVTPSGLSWFASPAAAQYERPGCPNDPFGSDTRPGNICGSNTEMWRVVPGRLQGKPAAVFALSPSNNLSSGACDGLSWNIDGNTHGREGWICVAARAADNIGNIGVSDPLRLCFDDGDSSNGTPDCSDANLPSCRGKDDKGVECTISAAQRFTSDIWPIQP